MSKPYETAEVLAARRRLTDAMHAMHADPRILVDDRLANELDAAWDAYDAELLAAIRSRGVQRRPAGRPAGRPRGSAAVPPPRPRPEPDELNRTDDDGLIGYGPPSR